MSGYMNAITAKQLTALELVIELVQAVYDTGYYSGKGEDGQAHHLEAIAQREALKIEVLRRLLAKVR